MAESIATALHRFGELGSLYLLQQRSGCKNLHHIVGDEMMTADHPCKGEFGPILTRSCHLPRWGVLWLLWMAEQPEDIGIPLTGSQRAITLAEAIPCILRLSNSNSVTRNVFEDTLVVWRTFRK